jgi:cytochrome P450
MRERYGSLAPVEIAPGVPATLVTGYRAALQILTDPAHYPADPRAWQQRVPVDCPALPLLRWRPDALRSAGKEHVRYRQAVTAGLQRIDPFALRATVERTAVSLINEFCESGSVDLLAHYAIPLTARILHGLLGFSPEVADKAFAALMTMHDAADADAVEHGSGMLATVIGEVVVAKRAKPAADLISWLLQAPGELDDAEVVQQTIMLYTTGTEPTWNLIANTLLLLATDDRFGGELLGGALSVRDAIDEVLFTDPPLANACVTYPRQPQIIGDLWLPEHQPVLIGLAACNNDPTASSGDRTGNRSHLAWGAGHHQCPAQSVAMVIVQEALDQLLDALPDIALAVPTNQLRWRPSPVHRAPAAVVVTFPPSPPLVFR